MKVVLRGSGLLYENIKRVINDFDISGEEELLITSFEDFELDKKEIINSEIKNVLCFSPITMRQSELLLDIAKDSDVNLLIGAVLMHYQDLGNDKSLNMYSGNKELFEKNKLIIERLGRHKYLGENIVLASMMNYTATGTHYGYVLSFYAGLGMSLQYEFPLNTYMYYTLKSLGPISEGAYRNVWGDFDSPSDFKEFDDVIHCGEMLVRDMKANGSIEELHHNKERQLLIQKTLEKHWNDLMGDYENIASKEGN